MGRELSVGNRRGTKKPVVFPRRLRAYHTHVLGQFGFGKSKLLEHFIRQDILHRRGLCLIDPHGSLYDDIVSWCAHRGFLEDRHIHLFDPGEEWSFGFNPLRFQDLSEHNVAKIVESMTEAFASAWGDEDLDKTPSLSRILPTLFYTLGKLKLSLAEGFDILYDKEGIRTQLPYLLPDEMMADEWREINATPPAELQNQLLSTRNRLARFLQSPVVRTIVGQTENVLDFGDAMDEGHIVLVNLGALSPKAKKLLGVFLVNDLFLRALSRNPHKPRPFYLYLDECYYFLNQDIQRIITECRKFGLHLLLAHQNLGQLEQAGEAVFSAVMQIPNKIAFGGLRPEEAEVVADQLHLGELDLEEEVKSLRRLQVSDYTKSILHGGSTTNTRSYGESSSESLSEGLSGYEGSHTKIESEERARTSGSSQSISASETESWQEALLPVLTEVRGGNFDLASQRYKASAALANQGVRQAVVKLSGRKSVAVTTPQVKSNYARGERKGAYRERLLKETPFALPTVEAKKCIARRHARLRSLVAERIEELEPDSFFE